MQSSSSLRWLLNSDKHDKNLTNPEDSICGNYNFHKGENDRKTGYCERNKILNGCQNVKKNNSFTSVVFIIMCNKKTDKEFFFLGNKRMASGKKFILNFG